MSVRQVGQYFMVDVAINGERRRKRCTTREEADRLLSSLLSSGGGGGVSSAPSRAWTLLDAFNQCHVDEWQGKGGEQSAVKNATLALSFFGETTQVADISTDLLYAWVARLKQIGNSNSTINRKLAALSKIMNHAVHRGKLEKRPNFPKRSAEPIGRQRYLTQDEEARCLGLLGQWGKDEHAEVFVCLIDTGLRPEELWTLEPSQCNFDTGLILLKKTKNHEPRGVPMTERVKEIIVRRKELTPRGQRLFPFDHAWQRPVWDRLKFSMGLSDDKDFVPYALRHTCASRLVQRGVHLGLVKLWLGHKTIQVTMRYAHHSPANLAEAVKVLEAC